MSDHEGWTFEVYESLSSTSDYCFDCLSRRREGVWAVLAHTQTKGRGTHQRQWHSLTGNLAFSFVVRSGFLSEDFYFSFADSQKFLQAAPYIVGVALHNVIKGFLSEKNGAALLLKWPNDLLWKDYKMAGILIESVFAGEEAAFIIGIGVNLKTSPRIEEKKLISLQEIQPEKKCPSPEIVAKQILTEVKKYFSLWKKKGFKAISEAWCARTSPIGTILTLGTKQNPVRGIFLGLNETGRLKLKTENGNIIYFVTTEVSE